jgi:hypothetical protein
MPWFLRAFLFLTKNYKTMSKSKKQIPFPNDYRSYDMPPKDSKYKEDGSGYEEFSGPPTRIDEEEKENSSPRQKKSLRSKENKK